jgi:hypothetical protein
MAELAVRAAARARRELSARVGLARGLPAWRAARRRLAELPVIHEAALRARRHSDRVFVFGSGASLNEIAAEEWERIAAHDTFGFNWFVHQRFVRCDLHLVRQISDSAHPDVLRPQIEEYFGLLAAAREFDDAVLLLQHEPRARGANEALRMGAVPPRPVLPFRTRAGPEPSPSFAEGLAHGSSTLFDAVNAAALLGWREIVLVGVDLYDRRYFWLPREETRSVDTIRGASAAEAHTQSQTGLGERLAAWHAAYQPWGIRLAVYNPRSLLAASLPVFSWD